MTELKIAGRHNLVDYSADGRWLALGGWTGNARVVDADTGKAKARFKVKGTAPQVHNHAISGDGTRYAFSCCGKVFVADVARGEITREWKIPKAERAYTVPMAFSPDGARLYVPDGGHVVTLDRGGAPTGRVAIHKDASMCSQLAPSPDGRWLAYKCAAARVNDRLFLVELPRSRVHEVPLPYDYAPGRQMYGAVTRWLADGSLAVFRKSRGLSIFDPKARRETATASWAELDGRSLFAFGRCQISADGRLVAMIAETSSGGDDINEWSVAVPDGFTLHVHDRTTGESRTLPRVGDGGFALSPAGDRLAAIDERRNDKGRAAHVLRVFPLRDAL